MHKEDNGAVFPSNYPCMACGNPSDLLIYREVRNSIEIVEALCDDHRDKLCICIETESRMGCVRCVKVHK